MKTIHIIIFGIGNIGSTLIKQINAAKSTVAKAQGLQLEIPIIANSTLAFFNQDTATDEWISDFDNFSIPYNIEDIIAYVQNKGWENVIAVDATASQNFVDHYERLVSSGFHLVSANKHANTRDLKFYESLRETLKRHQKLFLYETNVGAGLPIIETLKTLRDSGETIQQVKGVFSGSLSYVFNQFSDSDKSFSTILNEAQDLGMTEPDAREDLSGADVARKLLILARELGIQKELSQVKIESLVPKQLNGKTSLAEFQARRSELNPAFTLKKEDLKDSQVLRYVGALDVATGGMEVKLVAEEKSTSIGQLRGANSIFEIYTESYGAFPLVIQGAGAGKEVTARGVLSDLLKIAKRL